MMNCCNRGVKIQMPVSHFAQETARCRAAQQHWAARSLRERLSSIRELRYLLVEQADRLTVAVEQDVGRPAAEVVATDLLPTAAAAKFLLQDAKTWLKPRPVGGHPLWLWDCCDTVHYRPHGIVGMIGTWNYPVFLNLVPLMHAVTAGNGVLWKPSECTPRTAAVVTELLRQAGFPPELIVTLPTTREAGPQLADADIDFLHFTGSEPVGRKLAARLGERLIPSVLELSGVDALFVTADADLRLAAEAAWFGMTLNHGQTCMATRRVFLDQAIAPAFLAELHPLIANSEAASLVLPAQAQQAEQILADARARGGTVLTRQATAAAGLFPSVVLDATPDMAICQEAVFAPIMAVITYKSLDEAIAWHELCPFGLAAAIFTRSPSIAQQMAAKLRVGTVVVNDVIVPTAHPGTPFGGRRASGWGVTQGGEGLRAMTVPQVISIRSGTFRPHVQAALTHDERIHAITRQTLVFGHARTWRARLRGLGHLLRGVLRMSTTESRSSEPAPVPRPSEFEAARSFADHSAPPR
jgi:acyl-CoA reductase-like NAD-dependent aldehyde dehydrogenase